MKKGSNVSLSVIKRLPKYYRYLEAINEKGIVRVSSKELSQITGLTASQIRQDLNHYGCFGQQGYGYNVRELMDELAKIIGVNKEYSMVIIGFGNIGHALYKYTGFKSLDYNTKAVFDKNNEELANEEVKVLSTDNLKEYLEENNIDIGIITTPKEGAQEICDILCEGGIKGIWNFAPVDLKTKNDVVIENVHLDESLFTLTYFINKPEDFTF
ncbi:redox-sensing transcriptional repressor Rex [Anaerococcus sp. AGMB00486]|uniref:Redox-sensing transcriptional repressor Rex n=2 Tax=Anaerococcus TaxID=165779 RepID=A0ABX2NBL5_9FIRM|nr:MULTISPECIES: redox-sensing transcriptional repressor Rex [Anaerococcus]MDY3005607.1 redox-sensing transcriptional repressor Rex [Anaerococcus porci]MSS78151.1 redox-sensing transcriptional repressor Rex [Anaerococcus porci]NVF12045.1 redox-sensing transcriptional repressor Rex [Anaerococcus faecalis]